MGSAPGARLAVCAMLAAFLVAAGGIVRTPSDPTGGCAPCVPVTARGGQAPVPVRAGPAGEPSFDLQVPVPPVPVTVDGLSRLVYELHVTSFATEPLRLRRLAVFDPHGDSVLVELSDDALMHRLMQVGGTGGDGDGRTLAPGVRAVVYIEFDLTGGAVPETLTHRVEYARAGAAETVEGARIPVRDEAVPVLGPPLRGGPWAAVYHPSWTRGHRRVFYAFDGRARLPGRFAIDWIRLDAEGRHVRGDPDRVAGWLGYGADVLAVADAVVVATRDDVPESDRLSTHPEHPLEDATGNYVALDLGDDRYAFYEHLQPGSIRVAPGDRVRRGQVIAALGFTGHSTGPHLHVHVADAPSPLGAEGTPFVLERFDVLGAYEDIGALGNAPWTPVAGPARVAEMPGPNVVVMFGLDETDP